MIMFEKISPIELARLAGRKFSSAATIDCTFIAGMVAAPSPTSMFITGPLTMMTGRKKISLKKPLHLILPLSMIAIISAKTTMIGTSTIVCHR